MHAAKKVMCQMYVKATASALYVQKILTDGNGLKTPIQKLIMSVSDVMVIDTAASDIMCAIRSGTLSFTEVLRHAANMTNVSSIPMPAG
jgi:hypothetical protein